MALYENSVHFQQCTKNTTFFKLSSYLHVFQISECQEALGMESGAISDAQISASSQWDVNHATKQGRLHFQAVPGKAGSWSSRINDVNQWLQIDLGSQHFKVTVVATQGRSDYDQWVTKYNLMYSDDGMNFQYYREQGQSRYKVNRVTL